MTLVFPKESLSAFPKHLTPGYRSTVKRSPSKPLIVVPHTLSELTGPVYGHDAVQESDADLTKQHKGEPLGERIIVHGHVLDEDKRPVPDTLVEIWQANACGRYVHNVDQHPAHAVLPCPAPDRPDQLRVAARRFVVTRPPSSHGSAVGFDPAANTRGSLRLLRLRPGP